MGAFILTILGEIIAGVAVYGITEGYSQSGGSQSVIIERHFHYFPAIGKSSRRRSSNEDDFGGILAFLFFLFLLLVMALVGISALYAQNINTILRIGYWTTIVLSISGFLLLIKGILQGRKNSDWSVAQTAFYSLVLCAVIGGLVYLVYKPLNAPDGYDEMMYKLQELNLKDKSWTSKAVEIGVVEFFSINPVIKFIALQALGILPLFLTIISVIYVQANLANAVFSGVKADISIYFLIAAPIFAFISSLLLGIIG